MSLQLKIEYLAAIRVRYYSSRKRDKTKILDELCAVSGFSRKYAIRILALKHLERKKRSGRNRVYSEASITHLKQLWHLMGRMDGSCLRSLVRVL